MFLSEVKGTFRSARVVLAYWSAPPHGILVQNVAVTPVVVARDRFGRRRGRVRTSLMVMVAVIGLWTAGATTQTPKPAPAGPDNPRTAALIAAEREAEDQLRRAARPDAAIDEVRLALVEAGHRFDTLGAEAAATDPASPSGLAPALRADLRRAGSDLAAAAKAASPHVDTAPLLALLQRARAQLLGEVALGLGFQGSYSQSKPKEPAYGGHATGMGPAPAPSPAISDDGTPSPVMFEEPTHLPAKTYCGGPTKDHILESGGNGVGLFDYDGDGRLDIYLVTAAELTPIARANPASQRALSQSRKLEVRGRLTPGRSGWRELGQRRLRRRLRQRRPSRLLRHQLGPELPVPQSRRRHVRGSGRARRRGGRRLEHRLHLLRC